MAQENVKVSYRLLTDPLRVEFINNNAEEIEVIFTAGDADPFTLLPNESITIPYEFPMCWAVNCPEPDCPDPRLIVAPNITMNNGIANAVWTTSVNMPGLFCAWPANDPSNVFESPCELSSLYGDVTSPHSQFLDLSSLPQNTNMIGVVKTTSNPQVDCASTTFDEVLSCEFSFNIGSITEKNELKYADFTEESNPQNFSEITISDPPNTSGADNEAIRSFVSQGGQQGGTLRYLLPTEIKHAFLRYYFRVNPQFDAIDSFKSIGFAGPVNDGSFGFAGGNGGGWGGLCKSWSDRLMIDPLGNGSFVGRLYGYYLQSTGIDSGCTVNDHPGITTSNCAPSINGCRQFGTVTSIQGGINNIMTDGEWHCMEQEINLNLLTQGINDISNIDSSGYSRLWVDGVLAAERLNAHYTNNPAYHQISIWFNKFHGGSNSAISDLWADYDCIEWSENRLGCP